MTDVTACARHLPQHFNGCTCRVPTRTAGEVLGVDLGDHYNDDVYGDVNACILDGTHMKSCDDDGYCNACGEQSSQACGECGGTWIDDPDGSVGVKVHVSPDGERRYELDEDHAPIDEGEMVGIPGSGTYQDDNAAEASFAAATEPDAVYTPAGAYAANRDRATTALAAVQASVESGEPLSNMARFELSASSAQLVLALGAAGRDGRLGDHDAELVERLRAARRAYSNARTDFDRTLAIGRMAEALSNAVAVGDRVFGKPVSQDTARATMIASDTWPSDYPDDFTPTRVEAFEMNRLAATRAADSDNPFEMRMSGIAMLSTLDNLSRDETIEESDRAAIERLRHSLHVTGPGESGAADFTADGVEELRDALRAAIKVGDNNLRTYDGKTARQWRDEAAARRRASHESFERSDTDGALTQWAADVTANRYDAYAQLAADGGISDFPALMDTDGNLVPAKLVNTKFGQSWMLLDANGDATGEWVNPSRAATAEKRNAAMAKKGYAVGRVRAKAKIAMSEGLTQLPYRYRADSGFDPNAEIIAATETED